MKGFRIPAQPNKKEAQQKVQTEMANLQMAGRISQMMTQQLMQSVKGMTEDLNALVQQVYEVQYKLDAIEKNLNLDPKAIAAIANVQRLVDFNEASARADVKDNLILAEEVGADSTVVLRSTALDDKGQDRGIFRSRIKLSESGVPDLIKSLQGKKAGDSVIVLLNGLEHTVELLDIRDPVPQIPAVVPEIMPDAEVVQ